MGRLDGKVALITGATSGIGEATAELFAAEGAKVVVVGRSEERGRAVASRIGGGSVFVHADVSREADVKRMIDDTVNRFGRLDVLFNNAGSSLQTRVDTITEAEFKAEMDVLVLSVVMAIKHAAPVMKAQKSGVIINNTSVAALRVGLGFYLYSIAKAGVTHATKYAGVVLGRHGIRVNCISPGAVVTPIFLGGLDAAAAHAGPTDALLGQVEKTLEKQTPLLRAGHAKDVAHAALFLASDEGAYVNCHDLVVDGGMTASGRIDYEPPRRTEKSSQPGPKN